MTVLFPAPRLNPRGHASLYFDIFFLPAPSFVMLVPRRPGVFTLSPFWRIFVLTLPDFVVSSPDYLTRDPLMTNVCRFVLPRRASAFVTSFDLSFSPPRCQPSFFSFSQDCPTPRGHRQPGLILTNFCSFLLRWSPSCHKPPFQVLDHTNIPTE